GQERPLRGLVRRRAGRHHLREVRFFRERGLPDRERKNREPGQGGDADRKRSGRLNQGEHGRKRPLSRFGGRDLRERWTERPGRGRPSDDQDFRNDRRRNGEIANASRGMTPSSRLNG